MSTFRPCKRSVFVTSLIWPSCLPPSLLSLPLCTRDAPLCKRLLPATYLQIFLAAQGSSSSPGETGQLWGQETVMGSREIRFQILCSFYALLIIVTISRAPAVGQAPCPGLSTITVAWQSGGSFLCLPLSHGQAVLMVSLVPWLFLPLATCACGCMKPS